VRAIIVIALLCLAACSRDSAPAGPPPPIEVVKPTAQATFDSVFAWKPVRGATTYRVLVFNSAGERKFEVHDVKSTSLQLAKNVGLPPDTYSWQVVALNADQELTKSAMTPFEIK